MIQTVLELYIKAGESPNEIHVQNCSVTPPPAFTV